MKRIVLITGVSGFVGSYLCGELLRRGWDVAGLFLPGEDLSRLAPFRDRLLLIEGDLTDPDCARRALAESAAATVVHMAAESAPSKSFAQPLRFFEVNVLGTLHLLEAIRAGERRTRMVFLSSAEVYGIADEASLPLCEDAPLRPANPYAASKAAGHYHLRQYALNFGLEALEVRPFNMIGPGQDLGFVLPDFASQVAEAIAGRREPRMEVGRLSDKRDFLDVRDAAVALADLIDQGEPGEVYHLCGGKPVEVRMLLDLLLAEAGQDIEVKQDPARLRPSKMPVLWGSHVKLTALTGWRPRIPLGRTVRDTLDWWLAKMK